LRQSGTDAAEPGRLTRVIRAGSAAGSIDGCAPQGVVDPDRFGVGNCMRTLAAQVG
jgi:hypothetical protein